MTALTEEEARKRWCPFARAVAPVVDTHANTTGGTTANRGADGAPDPDCRCLASGCMAWRVIHPTISTDSSQPARGICGIAGTPYF